ncbi:MAG: L-threonylcarbamoyladenylate synthase, partial [Thermodesulfobacteriota bacterium]
MWNERPSSSASPRNNVRRVDPACPRPDLIAEACDVLSAGGVVGFPAAVMYGLAADAANPAAVAKVRRLKNRPETNPILLLVPDRGRVTDLAAALPDAAARIMDRFWPGNVTLIFAASAKVPRHLVSGAGTIGLRMPLHPVTRALVERFGRPVTGTSANRSGEPPCLEANQLNERLAAFPDLILDAGPLPGGAGSTVVDVTVSPPKVLREGTIRASDILAAV